MEKPPNSSGSRPSNATAADLGPGTFEESTLELTSDGDEHLGVPSDAWSQVLVYRKDLFEQAGLEPAPGAAGRRRRRRAGHDRLTAVTIWHADADGAVAQSVLSGAVAADGVLTDVDVYSSAGVARYTTAGMGHDECWTIVRSELAGAVRSGAPVTVDVARTTRVALLVDAVERSLAAGARVSVER